MPPPAPGVNKVPPSRPAAIKQVAAARLARTRCGELFWQQPCGSAPALRAGGLAPVAHELQEEQEEVDDVQVDVQRRADVVVNAELVLLVPPADNQLGVVDDVEHEDQHPDAGVEHVDRGAREALAGEERPEVHQQAEADEAEQGAHEVGPHAGEVRLREAGVGRERAEDDGRGGQGQEHGVRGVDQRGEACLQGDAQGDGREEEVVERELPRDPLAAAAHAQHQHQGAHAGHVEEALVGHHPGR
mmetsp:Transcript_14545/g.44977  ORF Transcript_14545/g.44977 Transcript_14545/m.44977 type:complete len:245 (-) Transcript_14545:249-983(-)